MPLRHAGPLCSGSGAADADAAARRLRFGDAWDGGLFSNLQHGARRLLRSEVPQEVEAMMTVGIINTL